MRIGSGGRARTCDPMINSHLLCQLSYAGTVKIEKSQRIVNFI